MTTPLHVTICGGKASVKNGSTQNFVLLQKTQLQLTVALYNFEELSEGKRETK